LLYEIINDNISLMSSIIMIINIPYVWFGRHSQGRTCLLRI